MSTAHKFSAAIRATLVLFVLLVLSANAATINITYDILDFGLTTNAVRRVTITPIAAGGDYTNGLHLAPTPMRADSWTNGTAIFSNKVPGYAYAVSFETPFSTSRRTNYFPSTLSGNVNGFNYQAWIAGFSSSGQVLQWAWLYQTNLTDILVGGVAAGTNIVILTNGALLTIHGTATGGGSGTFDFSALTNKPAPIHLVSTNDGSSLTNLNASNLASGTVPDARLSSNVPLKNAANYFTVANNRFESNLRVTNAGAASLFMDALVTTGPLYRVGKDNTTTGAGGAIFGDGNAWGGDGGGVFGFANTAAGQDVHVFGGSTTGKGSESIFLGWSNTSTNDAEFHHVMLGAFNQFISDGEQRVAVGNFNRISATGALIFGNSITNATASSVEIGPANAQKLRISSGGVQWLGSGAFVGDLTGTASIAATGDSATAFFSTGTIEDARLSANVSLLGQTISLAEMANIATDRLVGRDTAGSGVPEELTVGGGLEFTGSGGIQRSALTGEVTASAGSGSTTIADSVTVATWTITGAPSLTLANGTTSAGVLRIDEDDDNGANYTEFTVPALGSNVVYTLPANAGASGAFLQTDGAGALTWATGGSGAPTDADYLVGTANGSLSAEIVVGTSPGGELGGSWASPTLDDSVTVATWTMTGAPGLTLANSTTSAGVLRIDEDDDDGANYVEQTVAAISANRTVTWRDAGGTPLLSGDTLTGEVTATFDTDGSTATVIADSVTVATWTMTGAPGLTLANGTTGPGVLRIDEDDDNGSNYTEFQVPALGANVVYTLPPDDGDAGEQLQTDGNGVLTWEAAGGAGSQTNIYGSFSNQFQISTIYSSNMFQIKTTNDTVAFSISTNANAFFPATVHAASLIVTNALTVDTVNATTLNVDNANIDNYNVTDFNATNAYFQTLYATNLYAQTNSAAFTSLTNMFVVGTRYTNAAHRAIVAASFQLISAVGGTPQISLKVEQGNGITNIVTAAGLSNIVQTSTHTLTLPVGPTARYTFVNESTGSAAANIVSYTSSYIVW